MVDMRRREFITLIGGAASTVSLLWPLVARAQQPTLPMIGFLSGRSPGESTSLLAAFRLGLGESGYAEGKNLAVEYRWAEGRLDRLPALAADLARRQAAVIAAVTTPGALAAKSATSAIPIVFVAGGDPVNLGLVAGLNRPGGNITGVSVITFELLRKRLELICELVPTASTVGLLLNPSNATAEFSLREVEAAARSLQRRIVVVNASSQAEFETAFASLVQQRAGALIVGADPFFNGHGDELGELSRRHNIPAIAEVREFAAAGGLVSYGASFADAYRQAGAYTGRILKGEQPASLPVMRATSIYLVVNLKTARMLGLEIPLPLLGRTDEVIE